MGEAGTTRPLTKTSRIPLFRLRGQAELNEKTSFRPSVETDKKKGYNKPHYSSRGGSPNIRAQRSNYSCPRWWEDAERGEIVTPVSTMVEIHFSQASHN